MLARLTLVLLYFATFSAGILAGVSLQKTMVELPAFRHISVRAWAEFAREGDLGNGLVLYPSLAFGAAILTVASLISARSDRVLRGVIIGLSIASAMACGGLLATIKAAPNIFALRTAEVSDSVLQTLFDSFSFCHRIRALMQTLAFAATVYSLFLSFRLEDHQKRN